MVVNPWCLPHVLLPQGADPNIANHDGWHALDLACELNKLGKVVVKQQHVPVHALLVGWGAKNSSAFKAQVSRHLCTPVSSKLATSADRHEVRLTLPVTRPADALTRPALGCADCLLMKVLCLRCALSLCSAVPQPASAAVHAR
jgi:hypothetical protein